MFKTYKLSLKFHIHTIYTIVKTSTSKNLIDGCLQLRSEGLYPTHMMGNEKNGCAVTHVTSLCSTSMGIYTRKVGSKKTFACSSQSSGFSTTGSRTCSQETLSSAGLRKKLTLQKAASRRKLQGKVHNLSDDPLHIVIFLLPSIERG